MNSDITVIGGGAAGFMAAITAARQQPTARVVLLEQHRPLEKVRISGGGRCNVTNALADPVALSKHYPRGERFMRKALQLWGQPEAVAWFAQEGVALHAEADGRMFPTTNSSETVVDALMRAAHKSGVQLRLRAKLERLEPKPDGFLLSLSGGETLTSHKVIVCTGGSPSARGLQWLGDLGLQVVPPVPSLFSFNLPDSPLHGLAGVSAVAQVSLPDTKLAVCGPVLVTHWGLSGPAVLRLSAFGARALHDCGYNYRVRIAWLPDLRDEDAHQMLNAHKNGHPKQLVVNHPPTSELPRRLWGRLCELADMPSKVCWGELPAKPRNRLVELLLRQEVSAQGRTTYKEEFVTAGGVDLAEVSGATMEAKNIRGLYLAGEVLDIDGVTGGFNFQAAWTTGYLAGASAVSAK